MRQRPLFFFLTLLFFSVSVSSCNRSREREERTLHRLLSDGELLIYSEEFSQAKQRIESSLSQIEKLIQRYPKRGSGYILRMKAHFLLFSLRAIPLLEESALSSEELITLLPSDRQREELALREQLEKDAKESERRALSLPEQIALHITLASFYRFFEETLPLSEAEYRKALRLSRELSEKKNQQKSGEWLEEQKRQLYMSLVEVLLAEKKWEEMLEVLQEFSPVYKLSSFAKKFRRLENEIALIEEKLRQTFYSPPSSKKEQLMKRFKRQSFSSMKFLPYSSYTPRETQLMLREEELTQVKNQLIYRLIAYYHLDRQEEWLKGKSLLLDYYPEIAAHLVQALEKKK